MERIPCNPETECKYRELAIGCHMSRHHLFWPRRDYRKEIAREFRNLDENKVYVCRAIHDEYHLEEPPEKPSLGEMRQALGRTALEEAS